MTPARGTVIALLGAESTGKTTLAEALAEALVKALADPRADPSADPNANALSGSGKRVALVGEYLREFCEHEGRTPRQNEQRGIAEEQARRIEAAAATHDIVIADTSALMIAVYSEIVFNDTALYAFAEAAEARCDLTLLTALDLPWQADGLQRDGPHVREPVDALVRAALDRAARPYAVICGSGDARLQAALSSIRRVTGAREASAATAPPSPLRWRGYCERCSDSACERHPAQ